MPLDSQLITIFVLLLVRCSRADSDARVIVYDDLNSTMNVFSEPGVSYFSHLLIKGNGKEQELIVGARDTLYRLNVDRLQMLDRAEWKATSNEIKDCITKGQSETDCKNYIKVLHIEGNKLLVCGTNAFSPSCTWRELGRIYSITNEVGAKEKCSRSPHANVTSLVTDEGVFFSGTVLAFAGNDPAIIRDSNSTLKFLRTAQYDSKWLNEPQFVGSFETNDYVYFLFREGAVEYINCGKAIYSRIARVCKKDPGDNRSPRLWTTFVKARLNCSIPGEYPFYFDEIQSATYVPDDGLVYATFTTPRNSIAGSAVCLFNLTAINATFNGPYKYQKTMDSTWDSVANNNPKSCQNLNAQETSIKSSSYQLMDSAVQPVTNAPLYHTQLERIVHITVDEAVAKGKRNERIHLYVLYVSTEDNVIKKISVLPETMTTCVLEIWKPLSDPTDKILSMHYLKEKESLYIGTKNKVMKIPSQHCDRHKSKNSCHEAKDPYCGWNEKVSQCTPPPEDQTTSWNQLIDKCPTFTHPIPGAWSSWSTWAPCNQANSLIGGTDQCMCSSRQCNNPPPQNGGANCEGVHIQVTNCTRHGGWTDWSEWSACSQTCGKDAVKTRRRFCTNPAPAFGGRVCVGQESDMTYCTENPTCPPPPTVFSCSPWKPWSECSVKCGEGYQYRTRHFINKQEGSICPSNTVEYRICNAKPCPTPAPVSESTPWQCATNDVEERYRVSCEVFNGTSIRTKIMREERKSHLNLLVFCLDVCGPWSDWSECDQFHTQERYRNCSNNKGNVCQCNNSEKRSCTINIERDDSNSVSLATLLFSCFLSFVLGLCVLAIIGYNKMKKERHLIPSSPLYATKQNFYMNVPLREPSTPKRTPSFSKNSTLPNNTPKVFTKPLTTTGSVKGIIKPTEHDTATATATIKRNSNNLKNGYTTSMEHDADVDPFS